MRLIFGIRTTEPVSLTVTTDGQLPSQPPDLRIRTDDQDVAMRCNHNTWVADLSAGDHIAYMPAAGDSWFKAPLTFTLSAPATIVSRERIGGALLTWNASAGTADDPKNPWPPPLKIDTAPMSDSTWLNITLVAMSPQPTNARAAPLEDLAAKPRERGGFR